MINRVPEGGVVKEARVASQNQLDDLRESHRTYALDLVEEIATFTNQSNVLPSDLGIARREIASLRNEIAQLQRGA